MKIQTGGNYCMKIRTDYVTNSSSSSFILSFKDENSIQKTLEDQFPKNIERGWSAGEDGYLSQLLSEIGEADRLTNDDIKKLVEYEEEWDIRWKLRDILEEKMGMSYSESNDYLDSPEGQKMINEKLSEEIKDVIDEIGDNKVIVQVEHGDGGEGEDGMLEHEILPNLDCTVIRFSHH